MQNVWSVRYGWALILSLTLGPATTVTAQETASTSADTVHVLFLGNSFTYYHNQPALLELVATSGSGPTITTAMITRPGATLRQLIDETDALDQIRTGTWDFVVLQEQSTLGRRVIDGVPSIQDPRYFQASVAALVPAIKSAGAQPILLLTWGREQVPTDQHALDAAYADAARRVDATLAPAGPVWQAVRAEVPDIGLYGPDGSHPSPLGSYVSALTVYATITGRQPPDTLIAGDGPEIDPAGVPTGKIVTLVSPELVRPDLARTAWQVYETWSTDQPGVLTGAAPSPEPRLPDGRIDDGSMLSGRWEGPVHLVPVPSTLTLIIADSGHAASWALRFPRPGFDVEGPVTGSRLEAGVLRFQVDNLRMMPGGALEFEVVQRDGQLAGVMRHESGGGQTLYSAAFRLSRVRE